MCLKALDTIGSEKRYRRNASEIVFFPTKTDYFSCVEITAHDFRRYLKNATIISNGSLNGFKNQKYVYAYTFAFKGTGHYQ